MRLYGLLLAFALAAPLAAADLGRPIDQNVVHPLLLTPADGQAALLPAAIATHAQNLASLDTIQAETYLYNAAALSPLDKLAAGALSLAITDPAAKAALKLEGPLPAPPRDAASPIAELSAMAKSQPAIRTLFDGGVLHPTLELDGLASGLTGLKLGREKLGVLGRGEFGVVYEHPKIHGAIIKAVEHSFEVALFTAETPKKTADEEEATSRALAKAGAGPRYLGRAVVDGRQLSVRERIYGDTLQQIINDRAFGPAEHALVQDLLRRMAKVGLRTDDMRAPNIMIGRTFLDPRRRAYLIDGGKLLEVPAGTPEDRLYESLYDQDTVILMRWDPYVGQIVTYKKFSAILAEGLARSAQTTRWQRFKGFLRDIVSNYHLPPPH